jgi:hypothetical protein
METFCVLYEVGNEFLNIEMIFMLHMINNCVNLDRLSAFHDSQALL